MPNLRKLTRIFQCVPGHDIYVAVVINGDYANCARAPYSRTIGIHYIHMFNYQIGRVCESGGEFREGQFYACFMNEAH